MECATLSNQDNSFSYPFSRAPALSLRLSAFPFPLYISPVGSPAYFHIPPSLHLCLHLTLKPTPKAALESIKGRSTTQLRLHVHISTYPMSPPTTKIKKEIKKRLYMQARKIRSSSHFFIHPLTPTLYPYSPSQPYARTIQIPNSNGVYTKQKRVDYIKYSKHHRAIHAKDSISHERRHPGAYKPFLCYVLS